MLASITPLGERGRHNRWWLTVASYLVGSAAGGAVVGAVAGAIGAGIGELASPSTSLRLAVAAAACVAGFGLDAWRDGRHVHGWRRQVDRAWMDRYRGWVYGGGFGFQLGLGLATIVNSAAVYCMLVIAVMTESVTTGVVCGVAFGVVRAVPVVAQRRATDFSRLQRSLARVQSLGRASRLAVMTVMLATGLLLAAGAAVVAGAPPR